MKYVHNILIRKPEGKREVGRPKHRSEDNIKIDFRDVRFERVASVL
jgi:hypothetical protein